MPDAPRSLTHWGAFSATLADGEITTVNPNVLTDDVGTSSLARGCTGAAVLVQVEKFAGPLPPVRAHEPPVIR